MIDLFDISNMNGIRLWTLFVLVFSVNVVMFRHKYHSFLDPLFYLLLWMSTTFAVSVEMVFAYDSWWAVVFVAENVLMNISAYAFSPDLGTGSNIRNPVQSRYWHTALLLAAFFVIFAVDGLDRWRHLLSNGLAASAMYKLDTGSEKKQIFLVIIRTLAWPFLVYLSNYFMLLGSRGQRILAILLILHNTVLSLLTGERGAILVVVGAFGFSAFYFRDYLTHAFRRKLNFAAAGAAIVIVLSAAIVSAQIRATAGGETSGVLVGLRIIENRLFANADGLYYFVRNEGERLLEPLGFVNYNFGVFINALSGSHLKNMGWLLMEKVFGSEIALVQGANYVLHLQALNFISAIFFPLVTVITVWIAMSLRSLNSIRIMSAEGFLFYTIASSSLRLLFDSETFIFTVIFALASYLLFYTALQVVQLLKYASTVPRANIT